MLTKAYIKSLPSGDDNYFKVRIPLYEDNTGNEAVFDALLCSDPSNYNGYSVGDTVYVEFEDEHMNTAVIMGKLFVETPTSTTTYNLVNELKVTENASLPPSTRLGDYTAQDLVNLYNAASNGGTGGGGTVVEQASELVLEHTLSSSNWEAVVISESSLYRYVITSDASLKPSGCTHYDVDTTLSFLTGEQVPTWDIVVDPSVTTPTYKQQIKYRAWCTTLNVYYGYMEIIAMKRPEANITLKTKWFLGEESSEVSYQATGEI